MSDEKPVMKIEIEEETGKEPTDSKVVDEMRELGRQLADTLKTAWNSSERAKIEKEVREGVRSFGDEVDKVIREVRSRSAGEKIRQEAAELREDVSSGELTRKAREGFTQGLRWLSEELSKISEQFSQPEEKPKKSAENGDEVKLD